MRRRGRLSDVENVSGFLHDPPTRPTPSTSTPRRNPVGPTQPTQGIAGFGALTHGRVISDTELTEVCWFLYSYLVSHGFIIPLPFLFREHPVLKVLVTSITSPS